MEHKRENAELIVSQSIEESPVELSSKNPMVLSCGGIFIPYKKRRQIERPFFKILNLADEKRLSKVVGADLPKSPLAEILEKESLN